MVIKVVPKKKVNSMWYIPLLVAASLFLGFFLAVAYGQNETNITNISQPIYPICENRCINIFGTILNLTAYPKWERSFGVWNCTYTPIEGTTLENSYYSFGCLAPFNLTEDEANIVPVPKVLLQELDPQEFKEVKESAGFWSLTATIFIALFALTSVISAGWWLSENW